MATRGSLCVADGCAEPDVGRPFKFQLALGVVPHVSSPSWALLAQRRNQPIQLAER
jgi:hypothetical protein